jgi:branched-chain amino acid aminotransferase
MVNFDGVLVEQESCKVSLQNRGYKYGDSLFETIRIKEGTICFLEDHYFRLMASMRMLRMEIPMRFTLEFFEAEIQKLILVFEPNSITKVRFTVDRKEGGLYAPTTHEIQFLIEAFKGAADLKETYEINLFKDHYVNSGLLSTIKSSNRLLNVVASIYADENDLDNCILLNEKKNVVEASNANIFLVKGQEVMTPCLADGCLNGIARKKIIELLQKMDEVVFVEKSISPFDLQKADELFVTNAIIGIQPVTKYRKKAFETKLGLELRTMLLELEA